MTKQKFRKARLEHNLAAPSFFLRQLTLNHCLPYKQSCTHQTRTRIPQKVLCVGPTLHMQSIQTPPYAWMPNPPKSRQEMPSSVELNAFDRPLLLFLWALSPPPFAEWYMCSPQSPIWKQLACEHFHTANKNTSIASLVYQQWRTISACNCYFHFLELLLVQRSNSLLSWLRDPVKGLA